ncbi:MAG: 50S ribosomal protein L6 [Candidatus Cloacimonadota bacterium]|nr:MAG: 50S ribosomal protein L6 [Candidatus Cloacimonadota bacterium]PIE79135.1 MAG: 50S ribosomal protein L6 [Candidatus Delongbacteria bacterium]
MSRIGKKPVVIPSGVTVEKKENLLTVKGPKGQLQFDINENVDVAIEEKEVVVTRRDEKKFSKSIHGTTRAIINNLVVGVSEGFTKELVLHGVGYKMEVSGKYLILSLGYSHPIYFYIPEGITMEPTQPISNTSSLKITGIDKVLIGMVASKIRSMRKPEPYKGKGFRYKDEHIIRKAGKAAKK